MSKVICEYNYVIQINILWMVTYIELQSEQWLILNDDECNQIWNKIYSEFKFNPTTNKTSIPFILNCPFDVYNIINLPLNDNDYYKVFEQTIKYIFINCMDQDDYMYALDRQHTCFRYNPRINKSKPNQFIKDEKYYGGGYNVCFPGFYPDGDYYFFIAKDFRWGYLSHPWLQKVWIYGESLRKLFSESQLTLKFT